MRPKDKEVFASIRSAMNPFSHDPLHLYRIYVEKVVTTEGKLRARMRPLPGGGQQLVPVEDK